MIKKFVQLLFILMLLVGGGGYAWYWYQISHVYALPQRQVEISPGLGVKAISRDLTAAGIVANDFWFRTFIWQKGLEEEIIAGVYELPEKASMRQLVEILTSHTTVDAAVRVRFIEGWTIANMATYLHDEYKIVEDDWYQIVGYPLQSAYNTDGQTVFDPSYEATFTFLEDRPDGVGYEGYIFPDTYLVASDGGVDAILQKAFTNFDIKFSDEMRSTIASQGKSIYEIVTIASILEREFQTLEDKKVGAGVIANRLAIGMALQMDSTVNYITGKKLAAVTATDLEVDSPYNTYMYPGLPPGPIANPGLDSLIAAVYPEETEYLYFLHDLEGNTYFAKTHDEHVANKNKYLR